MYKFKIYDNTNNFGIFFIDFGITSTFCEMWIRFLKFLITLYYVIDDISG